MTDRQIDLAIHGVWLEMPPNDEGFVLRDGILYFRGYGFCQPVQYLLKIRNETSLDYSHLVLMAHHMICGAVAYWDIEVQKSETYPDAFATAQIQRDAWLSLLKGGE